MKKPFTKIIITILTILILLLIISKTTNDTTEVCFDQTCIKTEVANSLDERMKGLMFRKTLDTDKGMLFIFDEETQHSIWMKNTLIPLDIFWIDSNYQITHIEHAQPCMQDPCTIYSSDKTCRYIVETNFGFADTHNIQVGDSIKINLAEKVK